MYKNLKEGESVLRENRQTVIRIASEVDLSVEREIDRQTGQPYASFYVNVQGVQYDITRMVLGACEGDYLKHGELELTFAGTYKISLIRGERFDDQEFDVLMNVALPDRTNTTVVVSKGRGRTFRTIGEDGREFVTFGRGEYELYRLEEFKSLHKYGSMYAKLVHARKLVGEALDYAKAEQVSVQPATIEYSGGYLLVQFPGIDLVEQLIFIPGNISFMYRRDKEKDVLLVELSYDDKSGYEFTIPTEYLDYVEQALTVLSKIDPNELYSRAQIVGRTRLGGALGSDGRIDTV